MADLTQFKYKFTKIPSLENINSISDPQDQLKIRVAWQMADLIISKHPQTLGIGSGTTSQAVVCALGQKIIDQKYQSPSSVITTSESLNLLAQYYNFSVKPFDQVLTLVKEIRQNHQKPSQLLDLSFDGADEIQIVVDNQNKIIGFPSIKGGGGAHTLERFVAQMVKPAGELIFVVDESKIVKYLGQKFYLPIEVTSEKIESIKSLLIEKYNFDRVELKKDLLNSSKDFITDLGNRILMAWPKSSQPIPVDLEKKLPQEPGIIDTGIFNSVQPHQILVARSNDSIISLTKGEIFPHQYFPISY